MKYSTNSQINRVSPDPCQVISSIQLGGYGRVEETLATATNRSQQFPPLGELVAPRPKLNLGVCEHALVRPGRSWPLCWRPYLGSCGSCSHVLDQGDCNHFIHDLEGWLVVMKVATVVVYDYKGSGRSGWWQRRPWQLIAIGPYLTTQFFFFESLFTEQKPPFESWYQGEKLSFNNQMDQGKNTHLGRLILGKRGLKHGWNYSPSMKIHYCGKTQTRTCQESTYLLLDD